MDFSPDFGEERKEKSIGMEEKNGSNLRSLSDTACTKPFCSNTLLSTATFTSSSPDICWWEDLIMMRGNSELLSCLSLLSRAKCSSFSVLCVLRVGLTFIYMIATLECVWSLPALWLLWIRCSKTLESMSECQVFTLGVLNFFQSSDF